jgi:hypothetical protein
MTRLELLERVNRLNMTAERGERYWTCTVLYNTVIWRVEPGEPIGAMFEVIEGVPG